MNARLIHVAGLGKHPDAIYIGREHSGRGRGPSFKRSRFANPFQWTEYGRPQAVGLFRRWLAGDPEAAALVKWPRWSRPTPEEIREALAGKVLACWCEPGEPCHGNVLAEIADGADCEPVRAAR